MHKGMSRRGSMRRGMGGRFAPSSKSPGLADLVTRLFDAKSSQIFQDASKTIVADTQGDAVARVVGQAFEYEAIGSPTFNALGALNTTAGGIRTVNTQPVLVNARTVWAIIRVDADHTGYVMSSDSGSSGWTMRVKSGGIVDVYHEGTAGSSKPFETGIVGAWELGVPVGIIWHQTPQGGVVKTITTDVQIVRVVDGTDDALGTSTKHSIGCTPSGSGPFNGLIYATGEEPDMDAASLAALEGLLLARLNQIKAINLTLETFETVFQRDTTTNLGTPRAVGAWNGPGDVITRYAGGPWVTTPVVNGRYRHHFEDTPLGEGLLEVSVLGGALTKSVMVGVGDNILGDGQSPMIGSADNTRTYTGGLFARFWNPDDNVPVDPPDVSDKSWQPDFLNDYVANTGRRTMFTATGRGSTAIEHFLPNAAPHPDPQASENLYQRAFRRCIESQMLDPDTYDRAVDGPVCLCVVWWQGTQDVYNATSTATYESRLREYATARHADFDVPVFVPVYQDINSPQATEADEEAIRVAQRNVRGDNEPGVAGHPNVETGPDWSAVQFDTSDGVHIADDANQVARANEWSAQIRAVFP